MAATDQGLFVWGGEDDRSRPFSDGAMFDPDTDTWRPVAPSPLSGRASAASATLADGTVMVAGGVSPNGRRPLSDVALYSPVADDWTALPSAPNCPRILVTSGQSVVALGQCGPSGPDAARWSPATAGWEALPDSGSDNVLVSGYPDGDDVVAVDDAGQLLVLTGTTWTRSTVPDDLGSRPTVAVTPAGVFRVSTQPDGEDSETGVVHRLVDEEWIEIARGPDLLPDEFEASPTPVATQDGFIWSARYGICRLAGSTVSCVKDAPGDGLTRFSSSHVYDAAADRSYLWGGDFVPEGASRSTPVDAGVTIDW